MLEIIRKYSFDVNFEAGKFKRTDGSTERIKLIQNDNESTKFKFNFEEEIVDNTNVLVRLRQSTGYVKEYTMLIQNQKAEIILTNDILSESGSLTMSITLIGTDDEILTDTEYHSKIQVIASLEGDTEIPEQEKSVLVDLISQVNSLNQTASQLVEDSQTAVQNANTATQNASNATTNANAAAQNANNAVTELDNRLAAKVDKVNGKDLSTNDFSNEYKQKVDTLENYDDTEINEDIEELKLENTKLKQRVTELENNELTNTVSGESIDINDSANATIRDIKITGKSWQNNAILPVEYTQVDYIESSGTQYIDTGIYTSLQIAVEANIAYSEETNSVGWNGAVYSSNQGWIAFGDYNVGNTLTAFFCNGTREGVFITRDTDFHIYHIENGLQKIDTIIANITASSIPNTLPITLFKGTNNYGNNIMAKEKLSYCKIWNNNVLVRDFIPCYRNSDNEVGLYDLVDNVFYTNQGTGNFTYGTEVILPNPDYEQTIHNCTGSISFKVQNENGIQEQNITFPLQEGQVLAQDDYLADDGIHHVRGKKVFDGSNDEAWGSITNQNVYYIVVNNYLKTTGITSLCSHYKSIENGGYGRMTNNSCCFTLDDNNRFMIKNTSISTLSDFKLWLSQNPITVEYKQAQEIIEPYTERQAQAWEQIKALRTYKNITHISSEDETKPTLEVTYVKDLPKEIDILSSLNLSVVDGLINIEYEEE